MTWAYYNENDAEIAAWLSNNIRAGLIAPGIVDTRSIADVQPDDLREFTQCHFFAGIGGWSYAARLAGWPDDRPIWSGSCPCQPFSAAGRGAGTDDPRHLWPHLYRLVRAASRDNLRAGPRRPSEPFALVGEQVAGAAGYGWFDGVRADLAREGFASRTVDIPALAVDSPHQRNRLFWVALADSQSINGRTGLCESGPLGDGFKPADGNGLPLVDSTGDRRGEGRPEYEFRGGRNAVTGTNGLVALAEYSRRQGGYSERAGASAIDTSNGQHGHDAARDLDDATRGSGPGARESEAFRRTAGRGEYRGSNGGSSWWASAEWIICHDGKARRVADASAPLLVNGFPNRILAWRGFGNAIVAPLAAQVIGALMDVLP